MEGEHVGEAGRDGKGEGERACSENILLYFQNQIRPAFLAQSRASMLTKQCAESSEL